MTRRQFVSTGCAAFGPAVQAQPRRRNIVFILVDDHRFDAMGCAGHPWLKTPSIDRLANGGVYFRNAFVTSSLCSPSRASILTGQYMHAHTVRDNFSPLPSSLPVFPALLQKAGYRTAFIGKWHMGGDSDEPRPGFDHWVSFFGQGEYTNPAINRNGKQEKVTGYISDILTSEAERFIEANSSHPFCVYLSHKAVHAPFQSAPRHEELYRTAVAPRPKTMAYNEELYDQWPDWVRRRRYARHGAEGLLRPPGKFDDTTTFDDLYRGYCRSLASVDDSVGRVFDALERRGLLHDTLVVYMGDNGYMWGEHGLVDKRAMYESSIRVPMLAHCPGLFGKTRKDVKGMALNLDIAPTFLDAAGLAVPKAMHGQSLLPLVAGNAPDWRKDFIYEYEWEQDFPYTPTITGLRTERHSLMLYHGIWDMPELYDNEADPDQMRNLIADARMRPLERGRLANLIRDTEVRKLVLTMQERMHHILESTGGDPRRSGKPVEGASFAL